MSDPKTVSCRIAAILNTAVFIVSVVWSNPVKGAGPVLDPALPEDQVVSVGGKVTQRVRVVSFSGQMAFQWWFGEEKLEGMTNVSLVYPAISAAQAGGYRVVVTDDTGSTTSRVAAITINPTFVKVLTGPVAEDREASVVGAWADDDLDGDQDLFVANNGGTEGARNTLYRNLGDGNFERLASHGITNQMAKSWGAAWGDYDNDGDPDLFVANWNSSGQLLRNDRNGQFTSVTYEWPLATREHIEGAWVDYDRDGWLDLYVVLWGRPSLLYRNLGDGRFDPLSTAEVGSLYESKGSPIGCAWADYDDDGDPDMLIDAPGGLPLLHRNMGNGRFESVGAGSLTSANATGEGMGWFDFNNDGRLDVLMVGQAHEIHLNAGGGLFTKGPALPVPAPADPFVTWGVTCGDYDNDGDIDIFLPGYSTSNTFLVNDGAATFRAVDIGSPIRDGTSDECASFADFDGDGFLDLFVPCGDGSSSPNLLYRNGLAATGNSNGWLTVALRGTVSNGSGIGAKVRVRATIGGREVWQMRQIVANGTWSSGTELVAHFGLGDADVADIVRVDWPSGNVQELSDVAIGRTVSITEPVRISPARPSASPGGSVRLASSVSGVSYRWQFEGQDIPGQTESSLSLSNLTLAAEGRYSLVIDTGSGLVTNFTWLLIDTTFTKVTSGPLVEELFNSWMGTWGDLDGDDDPDLALTRYVTGGTGIYRNDDEGVFQSVTNNVLPLAPGPWGSEGLADLDNDGRLDLIAMRYSGATEFYFNEGGFGFSGPTRTPLLSEAWNVAVADYDRDGWLDVFIPTPAGGQLWRNEGARVLRKVPAVEVGRIVSTGTFGGAAWGDYDDDGWPDLFAPNFRGSQSYLFRNDGGRFTNAVNLVAMDSKPGLWGSWGDYDNDGLLDLCVARFAGSEIYRNIGGGQFERTSIGVPFSGNSATWGDYDNDGYLDLVTTASTVLYRNNGDGTFTALANGSIAGDRALAAAGYVGAWCDYDQDGFLDLYVVNGNDGGSARTANFLYRNNGNSNGWLNVKLVGTKSNRQGIGAKVKVQANLRTGARWQRRDMAAGDTAGGSQWIAHFGLATASRARVVRIEWPSGTVQELMDIPARQTLTVVEPSLTGKLRSNGMFEMTVTCDTNKPYVLEQSIDLSTWTPFTTVTGSGVYVDPVPDPRQRFYRLR